MKKKDIIYIPQQPRIKYVSKAAMFCFTTWSESGQKQNWFSTKLEAVQYLKNLSKG